MSEKSRVSVTRQTVDNLLVYMLSYLSPVCEAEY